MIAGGLAAAARFLPRAWAGAWAALVLLLAVLILAIIRGDPGFWIATVVGSLVARGALWRLASSRGRPGPGGIQFGVTEMRLAGVWALSGLFLCIIGLLVLFVLLCSAYAVASAGRDFDPVQVTTWASAVTGRGRLLLGAIGAVCTAGLVYAAARISLAEAATINRTKVQVLASYSLTRGRAFSVATAQLLLASPAICLGFLSTMGGSRVIWAAAQALVIGGLWLPMSVGLMAYAYDLCARQT